LQALCTWWLPWKTQQINVLNCFTNNDKIKTFPPNEKPNMFKLWCLRGDLCDMESTVRRPKS